MFQKRVVLHKERQILCVTHANFRHDHFQDYFFEQLQREGFGLRPKPPIPGPVNHILAWKYCEEPLKPRCLLLQSMYEPRQHLQHIYES